MQKPEISVNFNGVFIEDQEVKRPKNFSVQNWFYFWNTIDSFDMDELVQCRVELRKTRDEMARMQYTIDALLEQVGDKNDYAKTN
jgi:hypothetical protein